jgi:hypothetical protein
MFASQRLELEYVASDRSGNVARVAREVVVGANVLPPAGMALQLVLTGPRAVEPRAMEQALRLAYGPVGRFAVVVLEGNTTVERVPFGLRNVSSLEWIAAAHVLAELPLSPQQLAALGAVRVEAMATPSPAASTSSGGSSAAKLGLVAGAVVILAAVAIAVMVIVKRGRKPLSPGASVVASGASRSAGREQTHLNPLYVPTQGDESNYDEIDAAPVVAMTPAALSALYDHPKVTSLRSLAREQTLYDEPLGPAGESMYDEPLRIVTGNALVPVPWRCLDCTRDEAEALLLRTTAAENGAFLLRSKPYREDVALSLYWGGRVSHHLLARDPSSLRWTVNGQVVAPLTASDGLDDVVSYLHGHQGHRMAGKLSRPAPPCATSLNDNTGEDDDNHDAEWLGDFNA